MADSSSILPNPLIPSEPFIIVNLPSIMKLTPTNYIGWKNQIQATLEGYDLFKYID